jgi:hypothetical protein
LSGCGKDYNGITAKTYGYPDDAIYCSKQAGDVNGVSKSLERMENHVLKTLYGKKPHFKDFAYKSHILKTLYGKLKQVDFFFNGLSKITRKAVKPQIWSLKFRACSYDPAYL